MKTEVFEVEWSTRPKDPEDGRVGTTRRMYVGSLAAAMRFLRHDMVRDTGFMVERTTVFRCELPAMPPAKLVYALLNGEATPRRLSVAWGDLPLPFPEKP